MTKESLAAVLSGREAGDEITDAENTAAEAAGLVILFGYSDDNAEFRGAIYDEVGCYGGGTFRIDANGLLPEHEDCECKYCNYKERAAAAKTIEAIWGDKTGYAWIYKTDIPHASFDIMEDGRKFCRGIVFELPK